MYKLGSITFQGLTGFTSLDSTIEANYVQHALIDNKPRLQRVGTNLEEINAAIRLHTAFCVPENELAKLYEMLEKSETQPLTNGAGDYFGKFVLTSVQLTTQKTYANGRILECEASIKLLEALNPNDAITNRSQAFALGTGDAERQFEISTEFSDAGIATDLLEEFNTESEAVDKLVAQTIVDEDTADANLGAASRRLANVGVALDKLDTLVNNTQSRIYDAAAQIRSNLSVVTAALSVLKDACDTVDVVAVDAANDTYQQTVRQFRRYSSPIAALRAIRS